MKPAIFVIVILCFSAIAQADEPTPVVPSIVMHSSESCGPCRKWWDSDRPAWVKVGWRVTKQDEAISSKPVPWFEIKDRDGSKFEVIGPLNGDNFREAKRKAAVKMQHVATKIRTWLE